MTADWSLAQLARQIIDDSPIADPHLLARKVALAIPDGHLREAVDELIGAYVVGLVTRSRWSGPVLTTSDPTTSDTHAGHVAGGDPSASPDHRPGDTHWSSVGAGISKWQRHADAIDAYKRRLHERDCGADKAWKFLRDFEADDCIAAAERREDQSARSLARAATYRRLRDALTKHKVAAVGDLPDNVLKEILG